MNVRKDRNKAKALLVRVPVAGTGQNVPAGLMGRRLLHPFTGPSAQIYYTKDGSENLQGDQQEQWVMTLPSPIIT